MPTLVIFLLVLSVLVFVHELGHYLAARMFGIRVDEFAFGLPFTPPILSKKVGETRYSIYPLLFGGFVKLHGEEEEVKVDKNRSFFGKNKFQRIVVVAAGVVMNVVLAFGVFFALYGVMGIPSQEKEKITIAEVVKGSPAEQAGFQQFDRILKVEDREINSSEDFTKIVKSWAGLGVNITVERGDTTVLFEGLLEKNVEQKTIYVVPRKDPPVGEGALGVAVTPVPYLQTEKCVLSDVSCIGKVINQGFKSTGVWVTKVIDGLREIGKSLAAGQKPEGVSGPVGIYQLTGAVAQEGILPTLELIAILSINLAVFNILPIPALDGGRILFIILEWIRRKRMSPEFEQKVNSWGMMILLALVALITLQDIIRAGFLSKFIK